MRAISRHIFPIAGSCLFLAAPLLAQDAPATPPVAPPTARNTQTWTTFKGDPQRTGSSTADVHLPLSLQWRYSSDAPSRSYISSPLVIGAAGRQLVVFGAGPNVIALDPQTGAQVWKSPDFTSNVITPITLLSSVNGDLILVAQQGGRVAAIRTSDGGRAWETDALSPITAGGPLVVNTAKGQRIVCALNSGRIVAFSLDGTIDPDWQVTLGVAPSTPMTLSPDGSLIFLCGSNAKVYAIDAQTDVVAYSLQLAAASSVSPVIAGDQLITSNSRRVSGNKYMGGSSLWNFDPRGEIVGSPSVGTDPAGKNVVYFGTRNGLFYALDDTGAQAWKTDVGSGITGTPLVLPSMVVVGTTNGLLIGFEPSNGKVIWQYRLKTNRAVLRQTGGRGGRGGRGGGFNFPGAAGGGGERVWPVSSAPTAVDNQLYVLGDNAALYSFTTKAFDAAPPRMIEPSLAAPDDQNKIAALLLSPDNPQILPGRGPIYFAGQLDDAGSGVDPSSIKVTMDDLPLPADSIDYQPSTGILTATLLDPEKGGVGFPDGTKNITVTALDYAGNKLTYTVSFFIDNTAPAPTSVRQFAPGAPDGTGPGDGGDDPGNGDPGDGTGTPGTPGAPGGGFPGRGGGGGGFPGGGVGGPPDVGMKSQI